MIILPAAWCIIQGYSAFWFNYQTPEFSSVGLEGLRNNSWPYDANNPPPVFGSFVEQPRVFFYVGCYIATASLGYCLIIWCELRIMKFIKLLGGSVPENTKQMHSDVHKALIALAAAPFFTSVVPIWFIIISIVDRGSPGQSSGPRPIIG
ncbi:hypothetical protein AAVH_22539 [Aphelenchoides avenae]|nr:hypothetical protein AAVH_22539 [Aphelenchus avenae]